MHCSHAKSEQLEHVTRHRKYYRRPGRRPRRLARPLASLSKATPRSLSTSAGMASRSFARMSPLRCSTFAISLWRRDSTLKSFDSSSSRIWWLRGANTESVRRDINVTPAEKRIVMVSLFAIEKAKIVRLWFHNWTKCRLRAKKSILRKRLHYEIF